METNIEPIYNLPPQGPDQQAHLRSEAEGRKKRQEMVSKMFQGLLQRFRGEPKGIIVGNNVIGGSFVEGTPQQSQQDNGSATQVSEPSVTDGIKETHR